MVKPVGKTKLKTKILFGSRYSRMEQVKIVEAFDQTKITMDFVITDVAAFNYSTNQLINQ